jgi:hypothetical protein
MKRKSGLLFLICFSFCGSLFAQSQDTNAKFEKCGTDAYMNFLKSKDLSLNDRILQDESMMQYLQSIASVSRSSNANVIYTIPVVVHVVYFTSGQNVSDAQIISQIDVLNEDFGRTNADTVNTPSAFASVAAVTNFQFCLASKDTAGNPTNGIERRQTTVQSFQPNDDVKYYSMGGLNAWNVNKYLNIWVCNLGGFVLGYGELPASLHTNTFGVVVDYNVFGRVGNVSPPYHKGRTCTHEISHCFRLSHIWADDNGACGPPGDFVSDTPDQADATFGCFTSPKTDACSPVSPGIMFMNYMDYSDDNCLNMFTEGQSLRMLSAISSFYPSLLTSDACIVDRIEAPEDFEMSIYPNPAKGIVSLDFFTTKYLGNYVQVRVTDYLGKEVFETELNNPVGNVYQLDLSDKKSGLYFLTIFNEKYKKHVRIALIN